MQRGYEITAGDSVIFPDGSTCSIEAFNNHECGEMWMSTNYCVPEGSNVWDADACCQGLAPYLADGVDGQPTCEKIKASEKEDDAIFSSKTVLYFFMGVLIPLGLFVILAVSVKRRLPKQEDKG
jgi:hypothetical protein